MTTSRRRWPRVVALAAAILVVLAIAAFVILDRPLPAGEAGAAADALARRMDAAVRCAAWDDVAGIEWTFGGRRRHLWDRRRGLARVESGDERVLVDLATRRGIAYEGAARLVGAEAAQRVEQAWAHWANDSFWLNPACKAFDPGTERRVVTTDDGQDGLLVTYGSGGVTPGDSYLWILDGDGQPIAWRMWVAIIPVGGVRATWDGWIELPGGARIATRHDLAGLVPLRLEDVRAAPVPTGAADPFRELAEVAPAD